MTTQIFIDFSLWSVLSPPLFGRNKKGGHADADRHLTCKAPLCWLRITYKNVNLSDGVLK
jgi:hypothetical protein